MSGAPGGMGCASSTHAPTVDEFELRKGVPVRIEIPSGAGWIACKVGKALKGDNSFEVHADNNGPVIPIVLQRPAAQCTFEDFTEYTENQGVDSEEDEDYNAFVKKLPNKIGGAIDIIHGGERVEGRLAFIPQYAPGERLFMVTKDSLSVVDATVVSQIGSGSCHKVTVAGQPTEVQVDLNEFNHAAQRFESVAEYDAIRDIYLQEVISKLSLIEDAITGNRLNCDDQLIYITVLTDKKTEGSAWAGISSMEDLTGHLVATSPKRGQGMHEAQGVLVRAGPGTGKTVSLQQLTRLVAKRLQASSGTDLGFSLVPMLVSVQRLASYLKKGVLSTEAGDLLAAYIDVEYEGQPKTKDLLLQAYEARALVLCIDGVDEAAGLKTRIEDLITEKLNPMGIRVVASSRPEGVRLERYAKFITMDLAPLSVEQQNQAVAFQLKNSTEYDHLVALGRIGKQAHAAGLDALANMQSAGGAHYEAIYYGNIVKSVATETDAPAEFAKTMEFFELASGVPVMLSMYVLCLEHIATHGGGRLPTSRLDLYVSAVRASVGRRFADSADSTAASTAGLMLAKLAVANHLDQRREFTSFDVKTVLEDSPEALAVWQSLEAEPDGVPLIKTLEAGATPAEATSESEVLTKYQFKHLSFQESFFAEGLCWTVEKPNDELMPEALAKLAQSVWQRGGFKVLNDRFMLNSFAICGTTLGKAVSAQLGKGLTELRLTEHQIKVFIALSWEPLRGQSSLKTITLPFGTGIAFTTKASAGVSTLAAILADDSELPRLAKVDFGLPARIGVEAAATIAAAATHRKGLRFCGSLFSSQISSLSDVDAVLITSTLCKNCSATFDAGLAAAGQLLPLSADASRICVSASPEAMLASALKAAGTYASAFPKDLGVHLMVAGFSAMDMRQAGYKTAELVNIGYTAKEILASIGDGSPTAAALRELCENGLALELVAGPGAETTCEQLRAADIKIPVDEDIKDAVEKITQLGGMANLKKLPNIMAAREMITDSDGERLVWAFALHCDPSMSDINFVRNNLKEKSCKAFMQYLRFNRTVTSIDLHDNSIDNNGLAHLARALTFNSKLSMLRVSGNDNVTVDGMTALFNGIMSNLTLQALVLETSAGAQTQGIPIPQLKGLQPKELIDLASRRFGPVSAALIAELISRCRPVLFELGLDRNPLRAEGVSHIAEMLKTNDDIRELDLRFCSMHAEGAKALAAALRVNTSVERALLLANQLGAEGAQHLIDMLPHNKSLKFIGVQDNLLNEESKAALREASAKYGITIKVE